MSDTVFFTSDKQRSRRYHVMVCTNPKCRARVWTSSTRKDFLCMSCRRARGLTANNRDGTYSTLEITPKQTMTFGTCCKCGRGDQELANGICPDCRFYNVPATDVERSENGRKGRGRGAFG